MNDDAQMVDVAEAARLVACHPVTIRRAIARGELPALKIGSRYRVRLADLRPEILGTLPAERAPREPGGKLSRIAVGIARKGGHSGRA